MTASERARMYDYISQDLRAVICDRREPLDELRQHINTLPPDIRTIAGMVDSFFVFEKDGNGDDGLSVEYQDDITGTILHAVGLARCVLEYPADELTLVILHELAHIATGDYMRKTALHGEEYQQYLDYLIMLYNSATGSSLQNDYFGLSPHTGN